MSHETILDFSHLNAGPTATLFSSSQKPDVSLYTSDNKFGNKSIYTGLHSITSCFKNKTNHGLFRGYIFANKLFTRVSFCSSSGSSSIVIGCLFLRRFRPLQSESPEKTALIFTVFSRPSKSFDIYQRCC
jgi:hypothetical protein